jgi:hypothetical protein
LVPEGPQPFDQNGDVNMDFSLDDVELITILDEPMEEAGFAPFTRL